MIDIQYMLSWVLFGIFICIITLLAVSAVCYLSNPEATIQLIERLL